MPRAAPRHSARRRPPKDDRPSSTRRGYGAAWQRARLRYLANHPLCVHCEARGEIRAATVVDHVDPHRGDMGKFWDVGNWQALCKRCHDVKTATEDGGFGRGEGGG